ncbi:NEW3 domain-containing protein [Chloroflexota bacterium]
MRIGGNICRLLLCVMGLVLILSPSMVLAQEEKIDLTLRLVNGRYYNEIESGKENTLYLEIHNIGNKPITNIRLSSDEPEGWVITFKPVSIEDLGVSSLQTVDVNITPPDKTTEGRYEVTVIAESNEIRKVLDIQTTVEAPEGYWLWIGGITLLVVIAGFIVVFMRFGRQ